MSKTPKSSIKTRITLWYAALLLLCIGGMMSSTYSSFLYFQF